MTTSEPTTGEIVEEAKRVISDAWNGCAGCHRIIAIKDLIVCVEKQEQTITRLGGEIDLHSNLCKVCDKTLSDRLESLERELSGITGELEKMTARAEQAEAREKAAIVYIPRNCSNCAYLDKYDIDAESTEKCQKCFFDATRPNFKWRELPQDGEGK